MATFTKRKRKQGVRWTARVRRDGREITKTWNSKSAAEAWARSQETAIETGEFRSPEPGAGAIFADLIDAFLAHRKSQRRAPGKTFAHGLVRLKDEHGLEPSSTLNTAFWRRHALKRIAGGAASQTAASELAYAGSVLSHAKREGLIQDASGPAEARRQLSDEGMRVVSRRRERRLSDAELDALLAACDGITSHVPLGAIVRFALVTAMRRGEILRILWTDLNEGDRVMLIRNRKDPSDRERVDEAPLMPAHATWPRWDALELIKAQPTNRSGAIFPYQGDTIGERFEAACKAAKLTGVVFHLLRHEALSRYAEHRKFDPLRLQLIGGHRDLRNVARYAKLSAKGLASEDVTAPAAPAKRPTKRVKAAPSA